MIEVLAMYGFINDRLGATKATSLSTNQAALRVLIARGVYAGLAPAKDPNTQQKPTYPMVVLSNVATQNQIVVDGETAYVSALIDVKLIGTNGLGQLAPAAKLVKKLLHKQSGDFGEFNIMGCYQESSLILPSMLDGDVLYHSVVQSFRVRAYCTETGE